MSDLISRQAAIELIHSLYPGMPRVPWLRKNWQKRYEPYINAEKAIRILPSAQAEPQWIPCSDPSNLPKDERLWITREISDGFFTLREVSDVIWDMTEWSDSVSGVVAYMPYWEPEPYTERREE